MGIEINQPPLLTAEQRFGRRLLAVRAATSLIVLIVGALVALAAGWEVLSTRVIGLAVMLSAIAERTTYLAMKRRENAQRDHPG